MGGGGGGYEAPEVAPVPKEQTTKPMTESARATIAAMQEKNRLKKGVNGSILHYNDPLFTNDKVQLG